MPRIEQPCVSIGPKTPLPADPQVQLAHGCQFPDLIGTDYVIADWLVKSPGTEAFNAEVAKMMGVKGRDRAPQHGTDAVCDVDATLRRTPLDRPLAGRRTAQCQSGRHGPELAIAPTRPPLRRACVLGAGEKKLPVSYRVGSLRIPVCADRLGRSNSSFCASRRCADRVSALRRVRTPLRFASSREPKQNGKTTPERAKVASAFNSLAACLVRLVRLVPW